MDIFDSHWDLATFSSNFAVVYDSKIHWPKRWSKRTRGLLGELFLKGKMIAYITFDDNGEVVRVENFNKDYNVKSLGDDIFVVERVSGFIRNKKLVGKFR